MSTSSPQFTSYLDSSISMDSNGFSPLIPERTLREKKVHSVATPLFCLSMAIFVVGVAVIPGFVTLLASSSLSLGTAYAVSAGYVVGLLVLAGTPAVRACFLEAAESKRQILPARRFINEGAKQLVMENEELAVKAFFLEQEKRKRQGLPARRRFINDRFINEQPKQLVIENEELVATNRKIPRRFSR